MGEYEKYDTRRFDEAFAGLLHPFRMGTLVHADGSDEVGIAITEKGDEEYEASRKRLADLHKKDSFKNCANANIMVEIVDENRDFDQGYVQLQNWNLQNLMKKIL